MQQVAIVLDCRVSEFFAAVTFLPVLQAEFGHIAEGLRAALQSQEQDRAQRAYPDPEGLIAAITNPAHKLMASLQLEGGFRTEGVGAPSRLANPLSQDNLMGFCTDQISGGPGRHH